MYGMQEAMYRERCADNQRRSARRQVSRAVAPSRRWRRRDEQARGGNAQGSARRDYELAGR